MLNKLVDSVEFKARLDALDAALALAERAKRAGLPVDYYVVRLGLQRFVVRVSEPIGRV